MKNFVMLALVLTLGASICVTGCNKTGNEQAKGDGKKAEDTKATDPKPSKEIPPPESIVGRWEGTDSEGHPCAIEFTALGRVRTIRPYHRSGAFNVRPYERPGEYLVNMKFGKINESKNQECKITAGNGDLTISDAGSKSKEARYVMAGKYKNVLVFSEAVIPSQEELIIGKWTRHVDEQEKESLLFEFEKGGSYSLFVLAHVRPYGLYTLSNGKYTIRKLHGVRIWKGTEIITADTDEIEISWVRRDALSNKDTVFRDRYYLYVDEFDLLQLNGPPTQSGGPYRGTWSRRE